MTEILNFIIDNLVWILIGVVVILLAIIGGYADKTNFGEGKKVIKVKKNSNKNKDIIEQLEVEQKDEDQKEENKETIENNNIVEGDKETNLLEETSLSKEEETKEANNLSLEDKKKISEDLTTDEFFKTNDLDILLPKKDVVTGEFLQDVDNIDLNFDKKDVFSDIPDLDDVDLPSIKKKKVSEKNIWDI